MKTIGWLRFRFAFRLISLVLILSLISSDILWANPVSMVPSAGQSVYSPGTGLEGFARLNESTRSDQKDKSPIIYHIQDAHAVFEAQQNLAKIVEALIQKEGIDLVLVEGGAGNVSLTSLRSLAWKKVRKRVGESFLRQGKITGEEFLELSSDYPFELYGIEDPALYRQNLDVFLSGISKKEKLSKELGRLDSAFSSLESSIYPSRFRDLEELRLAWRFGKGDFQVYLNTLRKLINESKVPAHDLLEWRKLGNSETVRSIDAEKFLKEINVLESRLRESLLNTQAKRLWRAQEHLRLLGRLFSFELTSDEYALLNGQQHFDLKKTGADIERLIQDSVHLRKSFAFLRSEFPEFLKFYDLARKRDKAFIKNINSILREKRERKVILITGGFHSKHLGALLKEEGISRILISPEITGASKNIDSDYAKILRAKSKSTLRAPATLGSPFYPELKITLGREQAKELGGHIKQLISLLNVDHLMAPAASKSVLLRSELRMELFNHLGTFFALSNNGTAVHWIVIGSAGILGIGILAFLLSKWKKKHKATHQNPVLLADSEYSSDTELSSDENNADEAFANFEATLGHAATPAQAFAFESGRFFGSSFPVASQDQHLPPPPQELPLPVPLNAIPADLDQKGKTVFVLREVLQAMETMDSTMRGHQKESAERAIRRVVSEGDGTLDHRRFRQYLEEDIHQFFGTIFREMQKLSTTHRETGNYQVSEEIEKAFPRFPRYVKSILSENPGLSEDVEVRGLMNRISAKLGARPPVAEDLGDYVERSFSRIMEERAQTRMPVLPVVETPKPAPKKTVDLGRIQGQLRDVQRMRERFEADQISLHVELTQLETEYRELQESMEDARQKNDTVIQEALGPSIDAYESRIQLLRHNDGEIKDRLRQIKGEEAKLSEELDEATGRSELREFLSFPIVFSSLGTGLLMLTALYLTKINRAIHRIRELTVKSGRSWPFTWKQVFDETVHLKKEEKLSIFDGTSEPPAQGFAGFGVFLGWVIGGWALYQAYHGWGWNTAKILRGEGDSAFTFGGLLWCLEIFAAPIVGAIVAPFLAFLGTIAINRGRMIARILKFPFDYEKVLELHLSDFHAYHQPFLKKAARFLSHMKSSTLETILRGWFDRGEDEKLKAVLEKNVWSGENYALIARFRDEFGLKEAKKALFTAAGEEFGGRLLQIIDTFKAGLIAKKVSGAGILKDVILEVLKTEKEKHMATYWMTQLMSDPATPWNAGFDKVKAYYAVRKRVDVLKTDAAKKFGLDKEDLAQVDAHIGKWRERILAPENKVTEPSWVWSLISELLGKIIARSSTKVWFMHILEKSHSLNAPFFAPARQRELLSRLDWLINYEIAKSDVWASASESEKSVLLSEMTSLEAFLKENGVDYSIALPDTFTKIKALSAPERIMVLRAFRGLNPSVYKKDPQAAGRAFQLLADKEILRGRLAANNGSAGSIRELEARLAVQTPEDIQTLKSCYGVLAEKADAKAQGVLLALAARAPPAVLPVFLKSSDHLVSYYAAHPKGRDYDNLPLLADEYRKRYGSLFSLNGILLNILTDPSKPQAVRIEEAGKTIAGQVLVRMGFPENTIGVWDSVSPEEIIHAVGYEVLRYSEEKKSDDEEKRSYFSPEEIRGEGERFLPARTRNPVVRKALEKMGRFGLYSHWESARPAYYLQFLEDTKGLDPEFFKPGEKVRASYDGEFVSPRRAGSLAPIKDPIQTMKGLIRNLRDRYPNIYDNFIGPKREILAGKPLEDFITDEKSLMSVAGQFRKKVADWPLSEDERVEMMILIYQVAFSSSLQPVLGKSSETEETRYWQDTLKAFQSASGLKKQSELYRNVTARIKKRIDELIEEAGAGREGVVQFVLTRGSVSDFFRGEISEDCTSELWNMHFTDTVGLPTDPAFLSFRLVENGRWIGNAYAIVLKDSSGKFIFYLDNIPVMLRHPATTVQVKSDKLIQNFFKQLKPVLENAGFDYFVIANDPSSRANLRTSIKALGGSAETKTVTKPGGFGGQSEFGVSSEYIQGLGTLSSSISAAGTWITLDNRSAQAQKSKAELTALEKQIQAMEEDRKRLAALKAEKTGRANHLKTVLQTISQGSKRATAQALNEAAQKEELEAERLSIETRTLEEQVKAVRGRLTGLRNEVAQRSELRMPALLAQSLFPDLSPGLLLFGLCALLFGGLIVILIIDWYSEQVKRDEEYTRSLERHSDDFRYTLRPINETPGWMKHPLVVEVGELFKTVLANVSAEIRELVPHRIFLPIMGWSMDLSKEVVNVLSTARIVLLALKEKGSLIPFLKEQPYYQKFKEEASALGLDPEFDKPGLVSEFELSRHNGTKISFALEVSERTADDLLRGDISRDCTGLGAHAAFYETIPQFLLDPGFIDLKLRMHGRWVGNVYVIAMKREGKPVLVIDAVQLHPSFVLWPIRPATIADEAVKQVTEWAKTKNFQAVYMSRFISNFFYLYDHFDPKYPPQKTEIEKLGGFKHLKALGLWDADTRRNQYIETFSPHWNEPLRVDANSAHQTLLLRPIWSAEAPARSEMRTDKVWDLDGFHFEVPESDLKGLRGVEAEKESKNQNLLLRALASKELGLSAALKEAVLDPATKIRVRIHDETKTERIYKFIIVRPDGRRNFILEINPRGGKFHPYTEELNLVDTALMTATDSTGEVDLRDIFTKFGEPPDPKLHVIPSFGTLYAQEIHKHGYVDQGMKIFDLTIKDHPTPSIRIATKAKNASEFSGAKVIYDFNWQKTPYVLAVYSPGAEVSLSEPSTPIPSETVVVEAPVKAEAPEDLSPVSVPEPPEPETPEPAAAVAQSAGTAGVLGAGAAFIKAILAKKRESLFKASIQKIERIGSDILGIARKAKEAVETAVEPSDLDRLEAELASSASAIDEGLAKLEAEVAKYKDGSKERTELDALKQKISGEIEALKEADIAREAAVQATDDHAKAEEISQALAEESRKLTALKSQTDKAREELERLEQKTRDFTTQEKKRNDLLKTVEELSARIRGEEETLAALSEKTTQAERDLEVKRSQGETLARELASQESRLKALQADQEQARTELTEILSKLKSAKRRASDLARKTKQLEEISRKTEEKDRKLSAKNDELSKADQALTEKQRSLQALDETLAARGREIAALEEKAAGLRTETEALERRKETLSKSTEELGTMQSEVSAAEAELSGIRKQYEDAKAEYERVLALSREERGNLATIQAELSKAQEAAQAMETKLSDLKEQERKREALLRQIAEAERELEVKAASLKEINAELLKLDSKKTEQIQDSEKTDSEIAAKAAELTQVKAETAKLQSDLETLRGNIASLLGDIEAKKREAAALEEEKVRLLGEAKSIEEKNREIEEARRKLEAEQAERTKAEQALAEEQRKASDTAQGLKTVGERLKQTVRDIADRETKIAGLTSEVETEKAKTRQAEAGKSQAEAEREQLEADLTHAQQEKNVLEEALRQAQKTSKATGTTDSVLEGRESLEALLSELPESLWQLLGRHFPGQHQTSFQLTVSSVANELANAWSRSPFFRRIIKNLVLYRSLYVWLQKQPFYREFKKEAEKLGVKSDFDKPGEWIRFNIPGDSEGYSLELSKRDAEYLLRGFMSGDCTNCGPGYVTGSFLTATASHIVDPGFFNFKILRNGEWVGNVYVMAIREKNKPVLVIDAMQIPWQSASPLFIPFDLSQSKFPIVSEKDAITLADAVIRALSEYSSKAGFQELWLSSFVSNFSALKHHFYGANQDEFDKRVTGEAKIGGWSALKALGYEGHPYVESIGNPEAKKVWEAEEVPPPTQVEPPKVTPSTPEQPVKGTQNIKGLVQQIRESVMFSYGNIVPRGMEFVVKAPGAGVRWIAFDETANEWRLYEKANGRTESYPLFEIGSGVRQQSGTLNLSVIAVERGGKRIPVIRFLMLPPIKPGILETHVEEGGAIFEESGEMKVMPFTKKGFIVDDSRGAFFVHPGGDQGLDSKENISLPLSNHYDVSRSRFPTAKFILGWHTNPGGEPALHSEEENEIIRSNVEGFQLVASPKGISLVRYYKEGEAWKKRTLFTKTLNEDWASDLEAALQAELDDNVNFSASGFQLKLEDRKLLDVALEEGSKSASRNIKPEIERLRFDLTTYYELVPESLLSFIQDSDFKLVVVRPKTPRGERAPPMGLGVYLGKPGRDVFASFNVAPKEDADGFDVTIYVGNGIYELAGEKERLEIIAHELYQAFKVVSAQNPRKYQADIDLEIKIDQEIRNAEAWEARIPNEERADLGLIGGVANRTNAHVRARAFARLLGSKSSDGVGTTYTALLRNAWALARRFSGNVSQEDTLNPVPPVSHDAFRYTQDSYQNVVSPESLKTLFEMSAYVHENKEEDLLQFLDRKIEDGKRVLLFNTNAPTPWILKDLRKIVEGLSAEGKLGTLYIDLPPESQRLIDEFLRTGQSSEKLSKILATRFPVFLPREFQRPDLYENLLRAVYEFNLEARDSQKIKVVAYYRGRMLPSMPGPGQVPGRPGNVPQPPAGFPFGNAGENEFPAVMPRMNELPFAQGMSLPPLPLTPGVREAFSSALSEAGRNQGIAIFIKPLDEFLPEDLVRNPEVASILQIDKYTGFGPEKPENKLALYMSEQASPNQKSFALPIGSEAPFYEESINPGLPGGMRFNEFNAYPDLILSTAGDGEDTFEPTPDELVPDEIAPLVPVGSRSELRLQTTPAAIKALHERKAAIRELSRIGEPAVGPLIEALNFPSVSVQLGAIQALGAIGSARAVNPINHVAQAAALKDAARLAVEEIKSKTPVPSKREPNHHQPVPQIPSGRSIYSSFNSTRSDEFIRVLLKAAPIALDIDAETLIRKEHGRLSLSGWGFVEAIKSLERKLPDELLGRIQIRVINLNPELREEEIRRAFGITPELQSLIRIENVPVRHRAFKGLGNFLEKTALKIGSEKNQALWKDSLDILVENPRPSEVIDGRKLFLTALLHKTLRSRISEALKAVVVRLLHELGESSFMAPVHFSSENRSALGLEFVAELDRVNKLLATMA